MNNSDRISQLESAILQARKDYYNGQANVSDKVYDAWVNELAELDPKNLAVIGIGSEPVSTWEKYNHQVEMGSLNKAQTDDEYLKWHQKYIDHDQVLLTLKLDGLSVSLIYEDGVLVKAATRGSGTTGELITSNVARMNGVPLRLKEKLNITVRGEILLSKENFTRYFSEYSNTRNAASGISRRFDGVGSNRLTVLSYQVHSDQLELETFEQQFTLLQKLGFAVPPFYVLNTPIEVIKLKNEWQASKREEYQFDLDGLVLHCNNLKKHNEFGSLHSRPYGSLAFKFDSVSKVAHIADIQVQVGNSGRLTPVAIFNPKVNLVGAEVERATLHNFSNIEELGVGIGAEVLVCRSNEVIPFIEEVVSPPKSVFAPPTHCPECSSPIIKTGEYIQCPNSQCPAQVSGRIRNWIKELNILEWGDKIIDRLVQSGKVKTVADLYKLWVADLAELERMGETSATKCYNILWSHNEVPLEVFLGGLSIPMVGQSTIKAVMKSGYDTLEKISQMTMEQLQSVPGLGPIKAESLYRGLKDNQSLIVELLNGGVRIKEKMSGVLAGKQIVFTGTMVNKRTELEKMAKDAGAEVKGSVGKSIDFLVIADPNSTSTKAQSARKNGTKLISEDDFLAMVK